MDHKPISMTQSQCDAHIVRIGRSRMVSANFHRTWVDVARPNARGVVARILNCVLLLQQSKTQPAVGNHMIGAYPP